MDPDAWLRRRVHTTYLHAADDGLVARVRRRTASLGDYWDSHFAARLAATAAAAAAQRGRDGPVVETATGGIVDGRHGAGRVHNLVGREGASDHLERSSAPASAEVLFQSTGRSELLLLLLSVSGGNSDAVFFVVRAPAGRGCRGGAKKAVADVFLARANRGVCMARTRLAVGLGPAYWIAQLTDWLQTLKGSQAYPSRDAWSWAGVVGVPITQDDDTCAICGTLVCLEARHRLDFERRYGFKSFPYHLPPETTVADLKNLCRGGGVWTAKDGADEQNVLGVIQLVGGCSAAADVPGWKPCKLQVKSWTFHLNSPLWPMPPTQIASLLRTEGPVLGGIIAGDDYYAAGWQDRVYRGVPRGQKGGTDHLVVCMGFRYDPELQIEIMDNHKADGPVRWIDATAFTGFCDIQVEPLDAGELRVAKPSSSWWRRLIAWVRRRLLSSAAGFAVSSRAR